MMLFNDGSEGGFSDERMEGAMRILANGVFSKSMRFYWQIFAAVPLSFR